MEEGLNAEAEKIGGFGNTATVTPQHVYNEDVQIVDEHERKDLVRGLKQRHVQMIAIAGAIVSFFFSLSFVSFQCLYISS